MVPKYLFPIVTISFFITLVSLTLIANIIQVIIAPLTLIFPDTVYAINGELAGGLWRLCDFYFKTLCCGKVELHYQNDLKPGENALVVSNHKFFGDFFLLHTFALDQKMLNYCKYFAKDSLKYVPGFGWGIYLMGCIMVKRDWVKDKTKIQETFGNYLKQKLPVWIISYVEGTRYTESKASTSRAYALANGINPLKYLLLPRTKGFASAVETFRIGDRISKVYNVVLVYNHPTRGFGAVPTLTDFLMGRISEFEYDVFITSHDLNDIPSGEHGASSWLMSIYQKNDILLASIACKKSD